MFLDRFKFIAGLINIIRGERIYPELPVIEFQPTRPVSFVVVRFSDEYYHNFLRSECATDPINQIIEINNTGGLCFDNLSQAMLSGIAQAQNDLIAVVHEDVLFPKGWHAIFECSLAELEKYDKQWAILGSVGWDECGECIGHWSDPHKYQNTFKNEGLPFREVSRLDEQLLIFHRSRLPEIDKNLPGIHHIGPDLSIGMRKLGLRTYVIDAPTIHKYADEVGKLVLSKNDSKKIIDRQNLTYLADMACCNEYITRKWPQLKIKNFELSDFSIPSFPEDKLQQLAQPIILLSKGGGGSRLLSVMAQDAGVFLGNDVNPSGDSLELVMPLYQGIIEKFRCNSIWQKAQIVPRIRSAAAEMIANLPCNNLWGFKLPESNFLLPELREAFPHARYVHLMRDPLSTCLRRTHMTARLDNHIGRITLAAAYDYLGLERTKILHDSPAEHMAYTTIHQLHMVKEFLSKLLEGSYSEVLFEHVMENPGDRIEQLCAWLKVNRVDFQLESTIDINRATHPKFIYPEDVTARVKTILEETRKSLGYLN